MMTPVHDRSSLLENPARKDCARSEAVRSLLITLREAPPCEGSRQPFFGPGRRAAAHHVDAEYL